jgi:hypothetical protein
MTTARTYCEVYYYLILFKFDTRHLCFECEGIFFKEKKIVSRECERSAYARMIKNISTAFNAISIPFFDLPTPKINGPESARINVTDMISAEK